VPATEPDLPGIWLSIYKSRQGATMPTPRRARRAPPPPKPLHPEGHPDFAFQHPIQGCVWKHDHKRIGCYIKDVGKGSDKRDRQVDNRYELGAWLNETQPDESLYLVHQGFIDAVYPVEFDQDTPEGRVMAERIGLATAVIDAGGACTLCSAEPDEEPPHRLGCEILSLLLHLATKPDEASEDSLAAVVRRANEQIARMA
jgi:hypothetical protein